RGALRELGLRGARADLRSGAGPARRTHRGRGPAAAPGPGEHHGSRLRIGWSMSTEQQQSPATETLLAEQPQESRGISLSRPRPRLGLDFLERFGLPIILVGVVILFSILRPDTFATAANWRGIAVSQSVLMIAALALIIPLIGARFDVSVGANLGLCGIAA